MAEEEVYRSSYSGVQHDDAVSKKHEHTNEAVLDLVEEPYTTVEKTKLEGIEAGAKADQDISGITTNAGDITSIKTKTDFVTVTQAVNLDTIESNTSTNNAKVTNADHTGDVSGSTELTIGADKVKDTHIDFGTDAGQVSTEDIPENINLFYTEGRVSANTNVTANTLGRTESRILIPTYYETPADNVSAINDILVTAEANGYDEVQLPKVAGGIIEINDTLFVTTKVSFKGTGRGTVLKASDDFNVASEAMIMLKDYGAGSYANQFELSNLKLNGNKFSQKVTITGFGSSVVQLIAHGLVDGTPLRFVTDNTLPTGISTFLTYWVINASTNDFQITTLKGNATASYLVTFTDSGIVDTAYFYTFTRDGIRFSVDKDGSYEYYGDNFGIVEKIFVDNCSGNGIHIPKLAEELSPQRAIAMYFNKVTVGWNGDSGIRTNGSDNKYTDIDSVGNGHGFYVGGGNNSFVGCKSYYNNLVGIGFYEGSIGSKSTNHESQEELKVGVLIKDTYNISMTNLVSEAHGHTGAGGTSTTKDGVGIILSNCFNCSVQGTVNNRSLAGDIQYATQWFGDCTGNTVDIKAPEIASRPIEYMYDTVPSATNKLIVDNVELSLPNLMNSDKIEDNGSGVPKGFTFSSPTGITATSQWSITREAQQVNITACSDVDVASKTSTYVTRIAGSSKISVGMLAKANEGASFKVSVNAYNSSGVYLATYGGTLVTGKDPIGFKWATLMNQEVHASTSYIAVELVVFCNTVETTTDLNVFFKAITVTCNSNKNTQELAEWYKDPTVIDYSANQLLPQYKGQKVIDTATDKFYMAKGYDYTEWVLLN